MTARIKKLEHIAQENDKIQQISQKRMIHGWYYQPPAILLYLVTRVTLIVLACISFRKAPRGMYKDTWAAFLPAFQ